ncbi:MAG TPA: hypothetical protein VMR81_03620 [Patescibacteria group bacterium]|nr:hypothetical protein [Patescibacteria group bacterium]
MQVRGERNDGRSGEIPEELQHQVGGSIFYGENCLFLINGAEVAILHDTVAVFESEARLTPADKSIEPSRVRTDSGAHKGINVLMLTMSTQGESVNVTPIGTEVVKPDGYKSVTVYQNEDHYVEPKPPPQQESVAEYYGRGGRHYQG